MPTISSWESSHYSIACIKFRWNASGCWSRRFLVVCGEFLGGKEAFRGWARHGRAGALPNSSVSAGKFQQTARMAGHFPLFYSKAKIQTVHGVPNDAGGTLEQGGMEGGGGGRAKLSRSLRLSPPSRGSGGAALFCNSLKVPGAPPATGDETRGERTCGSR